MALDILLRKLCIPKNIRITLHAAKRLEQRGIFLKDVISCIMNGETNRTISDDYPYPSCLILGMSIEDKYLHVVIGNHESDLFLITAYFPSFDKWESDFKTRRRTHNDLFLLQSNIESSTTTYMTDYQGCYIIIKNVPCEKCSQCGEEYLNGETLERIEEIIQKVKGMLTEIAVVDYKQTA